MCVCAHMCLCVRMLVCVHAGVLPQELLALCFEINVSHGDLESATAGL